MHRLLLKHIDDLAQPTKRLSREALEQYAKRHETEKRGNKMSKFIEGFEKVAISRGALARAVTGRLYRASNAVSKDKIFHHINRPDVLKDFTDKRPLSSGILRRFNKIKEDLHSLKGKTNVNTAKITGLDDTLPGKVKGQR
jgi:hypothetical protein